jgi:RNA polymerase sigma factor (sigma-70 family)
MEGHLPNARRDNRVLPLLQAMFAQDAPGISDGHLLRRFLDQRDERAFAVLVRRHGSMVLGVCRRILGNHADAEDACQAAFMVLVRKAPSLTGRRFIGDWLHGVARRTSLKARSAAARRRAVEPAMARSEAQGEQPRNDWLPRLDEEIARLPEKYRLPLVLCDLQGKTRQQASQQLDWPEGTVAGRLVRARALLAKRLLRGEAFFGDSGTAKAAMPVGLVQSTIEAAAWAVRGKTLAQGAFSHSALVIAQGVMRTMFWNKVKFAGLAIVTMVAIAGVGERAVQLLPVGAHEQDVQTIATQHQPANVQKLRETTQPDQPDDKKALLKLINELVMAGKLQWDARIDDYHKGSTTVDFVLITSRELLKAELMQAAKKTDGSAIAVYQAHLDRMLDVERIAKAKYDAGQVTASGYFLVVYARIEGKIWLEEARHTTSGIENKSKKGEQAKIESSRLQLEARWREFLAGKTTADFVVGAAQNLLESELVSVDTNQAKIAVLDKHLRLAFERWKTAKGEFESGRIADLPFAQFRQQYEDIRTRRLAELRDKE